MKLILCDAPDCKEDAYYRVKTCRGYKKSTGDITYECFEKPTLGKMDLCKKHYRQWCEATYKVFFKVV